jgi:hypothetical protein
MLSSTVGKYQVTMAIDIPFYDLEKPRILGSQN